MGFSARGETLIGGAENDQMMSLISMADAISLLAVVVVVGLRAMSRVGLPLGHRRIIGRYTMIGVALLMAAAAMTTLVKILWGP